jgi:hypothetical protein
MKAYGASGRTSTAPLILNLSMRWGELFASRIGRITAGERTPIPSEWESGWEL